MGKSYVTKKNLFKFLLGSAFGILMFLVPIPQGESFTTLLDFLKSWIKGLFGSNLSYIITVMLVFSAVVSVYDFIAKPDWIRKNHYLSRAFSTTPLYLGSKILGAVFVFCRDAFFWGTPWSYGTGIAAGVVIVRLLSSVVIGIALVKVITAALVKTGVLKGFVCAK